MSVNKESADYLNYDIELKNNKTQSQVSNSQGKNLNQSLNDSSIPMIVQKSHSVLQLKQRNSSRIRESIDGFNFTGPKSFQELFEKVIMPCSQEQNVQGIEGDQVPSVYSEMTKKSSKKEIREDESNIQNPNKNNNNNNNFFKSNNSFSSSSSDSSSDSGSNSQQSSGIDNNNFQKKQRKKQLQQQQKNQLNNTQQKSSLSSFTSINNTKKSSNNNNNIVKNNSNSSIILQNNSSIAQQRARIQLDKIRIDLIHQSKEPSITSKMGNNNNYINQPQLYSFNSPLKKGDQSVRSKKGKNNYYKYSTRNVLKSMRNLSIYQRHQKRDFFTQFIDGIKYFKNQTFLSEKKLTFKINTHINDIVEISKRYEIKKGILDFVPLFMPYNKIRIMFDYFLCCIYTIYVYVFSISLFFGSSEDSKEDQSFTDSITRIILIFCLFAEVIVQSNTAFLHQGLVIKDRKVIFKNYLKASLVFDILAFLPFLSRYFEMNPELRFSINLLSFSKMVNFQQMGVRIISYSNLQGWKRHFISILTLIWKLYALIHFLGIFWHGIGLYEINYLGYKNTWLDQIDMRDEPEVVKRYIYSVYFIAVTMNTVGYGDISPQNSLECVYTTVIMLTSGIMYAYTINEIGNIMRDMRQHKKLYKNDLEAIKIIAKEERLNSDLYQRIINYLECMNSHDNVVSREAQFKVYNKLSTSLQKEMTTDIVSKYMKDIKLLQTRFSKQTIEKMQLKFKEVRFSSEDIVYQQNEKKDLALFYIIQGQVDIIFPQKKGDPPIVLATLKDREYFGEFSFFSGLPTNSAVKAHSFCRFLKIERKDFLEVLKESPVDFEHYNQSQHDILLNIDDLYKENPSQQQQANQFQKTSMQRIVSMKKSSSYLSPNVNNSVNQYNQKCYSVTNCLSCGSSFHTQKQCRLTHLILNKDPILYRHILSEFQERKKNERSYFLRKYNAYRDIVDVQLQVLQIIEKREFYMEIEEISQNIQYFSDDPDLFTHSNFIYENSSGLSSITDESDDSLSNSSGSNSSEEVQSQQQIIQKKKRKSNNNNNNNQDPFSCKDNINIMNNLNPQNLEDGSIQPISSQNPIYSMGSNIAIINTTSGDILKTPEISSYNKNNSKNQYNNVQMLLQPTMDRGIQKVGSSQCSSALVIQPSPQTPQIVPTKLEDLKNQRRRSQSVDYIKQLIVPKKDSSHKNRINRQRKKRKSKSIKMNLVPELVTKFQNIKDDFQKRESVIENDLKRYSGVLQEGQVMDVNKRNSQQIQQQQSQQQFIFKNGNMSNSRQQGCQQLTLQINPSTNQIEIIDSNEQFNLPLQFENDKNLLEFDKMNDFQYYKPHNNYTNILASLIKDVFPSFQEQQRRKSKKFLDKSRTYTKRFLKTRKSIKQRQSVLINPTTSRLIREFAQEQNIYDGSKSCYHSNNTNNNTYIMETQGTCDFGGALTHNNNNTINNNNFLNNLKISQNSNNNKNNINSNKSDFQQWASQSASESPSRVIKSDLRNLMKSNTPQKNSKLILNNNNNIKDNNNNINNDGKIQIQQNQNQTLNSNNNKSNSSINQIKSNSIVKNGNNNNKQSTTQASSFFIQSQQNLINDEDKQNSK